MATFTSNEDVINAYQSKPVLWDTVLNVTDEEKELAWRKHCSKRWGWVGCAVGVWNSIVEWSVRAGWGWV